MGDGADGRGGGVGSLDVDEGCAGGVEGLRDSGGAGRTGAAAMPDGVVAGSGIDGLAGVAGIGASALGAALPGRRTPAPRASRTSGGIATTRRRGGEAGGGAASGAPAVSGVGSLGLVGGAFGLAGPPGGWTLRASPTSGCTVNRPRRKRPRNEGFSCWAARSSSSGVGM